MNTKRGEVLQKNIPASEKPVKSELLAPAGSIEAFFAALDHGKTRDTSRINPTNPGSDKFQIATFLLPDQTRLPVFSSLPVVPLTAGWR